MFTTLIVCFDNWNTLAEVPFIIKKAGSNVHIYCSNESWLKKNSFYDKWIPAKPEDPEEYRLQLLDLVVNNNYDWVLLGDEKIIRLMNETITEESLFYKILPLAKIENREMLSSKSGLDNICKKYKVLTPLCCIYNSTDKDASFISLKFPLIIKINFSWGGVGIKPYYNKEELAKALAIIPEGENVIIQEFIKGKEIPVEALFWKGKLLAITSCEILEYDKNEFSYSTRRKYFPPDKQLELVVMQFGVDAGLHGFVNMSYIHSYENNLYYLIEADTRPNSWNAYAHHTGSSFSEVLKVVFNSNAVAKSATPKTAEIALFHKDIRRAFYKRDVKGLLRWLYKTSYWRYIPFYDSKLFGNTLVELWKEFITPKLQRR